MSVLHCNERLTQKLLNLDQRNTSKMPKTVILKLILKKRIGDILIRLFSETQKMSFDCFQKFENKLLKIHFHLLKSTFWGQSNPQKFRKKSICFLKSFSPNFKYAHNKSLKRLFVALFGILSVYCILKRLFDFKLVSHFSATFS